MRLLIFTTVFVVAVSIPVSATIINVPDDCSTIQQGIDASSDGDTVLVQPDTYVENINYNGHNIILGSLFLTTGDTSYISSTIIDGDSSGTVVTFENGEDSTAVITGFTIQNGAADAGGGIYCDGSNPSLENVTISGNTAGWWGGGIYCDGSDPSLEDVTISGNTAGWWGGGICCDWYSNPSLENVKISGNTAECGGGIFCYYSNPSFDSANRCNIFLNYAGSGNDLYAFSCPTIDVIVDTFTVSQPDDYFAFPIDNFTFDILNAKIEQVNQDLYVSPDGSDDNSGLNVDDPLLTVSWALTKILADSTNPLTIHLSNGTYSPSETGERFSLNCRSYVSLLGEDEASTILDGEGLSGILYCKNDNDFFIENVTIQNGSADYGGGIYGGSPSLVNVTISGNTAEHGGGIYGGRPSLENVTISGNTAEYGGGICCGRGSMSLVNVTMSGNTARVGGGIHCGGNPSLVNVTISGNTADDGGGISCWTGSPSLKNVTISGNTADEGAGGGIDCELTDMSLENVTISGNTAGWGGGGIYFLYSSSSLVNVTISGNTAGRGGGICCYDCSPSLELENVTISGNTAGCGGGTYCSGWDGPSLVNCILWNDTPQEIYVYSGSVTATYSCVQGGWTGTGNIDADPVFVSGPLSNYHLCPFTPSPCIDAGNPDPQYNDPENPLIPGYAMWPALGTVRNDMGMYGGPNTAVWTGVEEDEDLLPSTFLLIKTYPNPFSTKMTIDIRLQTTDQNQKSSVSGNRSSVCIYDITGRLVHTIPLNLCNLNKSVQSVIWDGRDNSGKAVPCGVYFLKFNAGDYSVTKKLLKVR